MGPFSTWTRFKITYLSGIVFVCTFKVKEEEKKKEIKKYTVKPPKDLRSKFILKMEARAVAAKKAEDEKRKAEEEKRILVSL